MTQDVQVRKLFSLLSSGLSLRLASLKTGMDEKWSSAKKISGSSHMNVRFGSATSSVGWTRRPAWVENRSAAERFILFRRWRMLVVVSPF